MPNTYILFLTEHVLRIAHYNCNTKTLLDYAQHSFSTDNSGINSLTKILSQTTQHTSFKHSNYYAYFFQADPLLAIEPELFTLIEQQYEILFTPISGDEMALRHLQAAQHVLHHQHKTIQPFCLLNIEQDATTIIFFQEGTHRAKRFEVGTLTLKQNSLDKMRTLAQQQLLRKASIFIDTFIITQGGRPTSSFISGRAAFLIATFLEEKPLNETSSNAVTGYQLSRALLKQAVHKIESMDAISRAHYVGKYGNELLASIVITELLFEILDYSVSTLLGDTLCEGIALKQ